MEEIKGLFPNIVQTEVSDITKIKIEPCESLNEAEPQYTVVKQEEDSYCLAPVKLKVPKHEITDVHEDTSIKTVNNEELDVKTEPGKDIPDSLPEINTKRKLFHCALCNRGFTLKNNIRRHLNIRLNKPFECKACDYTCLRKCALKQHKESHSKDNLCKHHMEAGAEEEPFIAGYQSTTTHLKKEAKPFKCGVCDFRTAIKQNLKAHNLRAHIGEKPFKCDVCKYECNTEHQLKQHTMTHRKVKLFKCGECYFKCFSKQNLKLHNMRAHTGERPFKCGLCDYRSITKQQLKQHNMVTHTGEKPFVCVVCNYRGVVKHQLKAHMMTHRTGKSTNNCGECEYKCTTKFPLKEHMKKNAEQKNLLSLITEALLKNNRNNTG